MMPSNRWLQFTSLSLVFVLVMVIGCTPGGRQAEPLVLPNDLDLDVSEFPDDSANPDEQATSTRPFDSANARTCAAGGAMIYGFQRLLDRGLTLADVINEDMVDPADPTLEGSFSTSSDNVIAYKVDFSPFDIDGDGDADGSGRADTAPIALRMWLLIDGVPARYLSALITERATTENAGAGTLYLQPGVIHPLVNPDFRIRISWDRTRPEYRWNQAYTIGTLRGNLNVNNGHHLVEHILLDDGSLQKSARSTATINRSDFDLTEVRYSARTIVGTGAGIINASGSGSAALSVTGLCVELPGCSVVSQDQCSEIRTSDLPYLGSPLGNETDWPADFPEQPTF